jgi:hypothetical protein
MKQSDRQLRTGVRLGSQPYGVKELDFAWRLKEWPANPFDHSMRGISERKPDANVAWVHSELTLLPT